MIKRGPSLEIIARLVRSLIPLLCLTASLHSQNHNEAGAVGSPTVVHARVTLGLDGISGNTAGELLIQDDAVSFRSTGGQAARILIASIENVFLSQEDKELGGTTMALGRAATPFGGGRVIGLFAHKAYDMLTLEYRDSNLGLHAAVFQLNKGHAQSLVNELKIKRTHVSGLRVATATQTPEVTNEAR